MSYQQFDVSSVNPNDNAGGGGCACDPRKQEDCKPPYIVIRQNEMLDHLSPHVVICAACVNAFQKALEGEQLEIGIPVTAAHEADQNNTHRAKQKESPEFDDSQLLDALKAKDETPDI